jgi:hypothetical protein
VRVRLLAPARDELREAFDYYQNLEDGLGDSSLAEVRVALRRVRQNPHAWQLLGRTIRRCRLQRFPYGLIYEPTAQEIIIIAVAHLHRHPSYWHHRQE